jgi:hypothetical protein
VVRFTDVMALVPDPVRTPLTGTELLVRLNVVPVAPATLAVIVYAPVCPFAVKLGAVAIPLTVTAVAVGDPLKAALAPLLGAVNVTVIPLSKLLPASLTVACRAVAKAVLTIALCGVPLVAVILAGGPALFVRLKLAPVATPETVAVTV